MKHYFYNQAVIPCIVDFFKLPHAYVLVLISNFSSKLGTPNKKNSECTDTHFAEKAKVKILMWQRKNASKGRISKISKGFGKKVEKRQAKETGKRGDDLGSVDLGHRPWMGWNRGTLRRILWLIFRLIGPGTGRLAGRWPFQRFRSRLSAACGKMLSLLPLLVKKEEQREEVTGEEFFLQFSCPLKT